MATTVKLTDAPSQSNCVKGCVVITGNPLIVTVNIQLETFPAESVAFQVTVVVPTLNATPFRLVPVPVVLPDKV